MNNLERAAEVMNTHDLFHFTSGDGWTEPYEDVIRCACGEEFFSYIQTGDGSYDDDRDPDLLYRQHLTQALDDAGLLMPDLPEPYESHNDPKWREEYQIAWWGEYGEDLSVPSLWTKVGENTTLQVFSGDAQVCPYYDGEPEEPIDADEARQIGLKWLAAAKLAEEQK